MSAISVDGSRVKQQVHVSLTDEELRQVDTLAERQERSRSSVLRLMVKKCLESDAQAA